MKIFIDVDDTLYNISSVLTGKSVGEILTAELRAPLFDHAKETIEKFNHDGHDCWLITGRGSVCDEEMENLKKRLKADKFTIPEGQSLFKGGAKRCSYRKDKAIEKIYKDNYNSEVVPKECILIDDDVVSVLATAMAGVKSILFNPKEEEIDEQTQQALHDLKVSKARSWEEVEKIVDNFCKEKGQGKE